MLLMITIIIRHLIKGTTMAQDNPEQSAIASNPINDGVIDGTTDPVSTAASGIDSAASLDSSTVASVPDATMHQFMEFMQVGGPVVWILTAFSVIALTIVLVKICQLISTKPESSKHIKASLRAWEKGENILALQTLNSKRPVDEVVMLAIRGLSDKSTDINLLKEELDRIATLRLNQLRAYLRPLEVIATLSPLLGLLGTVLGMIVAFQQMEAAGNQVDPSVLSGGIWQALLTTAVGLAVAIPVVTMHNWLERKVERVAALMNDAVTQVFTVKQLNTTVDENQFMRHAA
ncbi:hypothetical protein LCGC14_1435700 [marine sediment metagenome]|uniref:MotA/TolQ/ExbB proton channel domain-containing protein n=2 Tax=root TaxID=1 RepID=A0A0F9K8F2_9ZZZZ